MQEPRGISVNLSFVFSLAEMHALTPEKCLKMACLFRLLNPFSEVRAAATVN